MKATRKSYAVLILTALGVLPASAAETRVPDTDRAAFVRLDPLEVERATVVKAVKRVHDDIRAGRLGH